jgi:hypothetical protein
VEVVMVVEVLVMVVVGAGMQGEEVEEEATRKVVEDTRFRGVFRRSEPPYSLGIAYVMIPPTQGPDEGKKGSNEGPKGSNEGPKGSNEGPKGSNEGPKGYNEGPKGPKEGLKGPNEGPSQLRNTICSGRS